MAHFPFQRLQAELAELIARTPAGDRLPSEPDLARQLGVSRATLREAMRTFETQGLIRRRQGAGTFVVGLMPVIDSGLEVLESLDKIAQRMNLPISLRHLHVEQVQADEAQAVALGLDEGVGLTRVRRVMQATDRPVAYLVDLLPADVMHPDQLPADFKGSVLDLLVERGDPLTVSRTAVSAINATAEVAKALEIQRDDVLLQFTGLLYTAAGKAVDYSLSYFIPGYFNFHVVRRVARS